MTRILVISESLGEPNHQRGIFHFTRELVRSLGAQNCDITLLVEKTRRYRKLRRLQARLRLTPAGSRLVELLALHRFLGDIGDGGPDRRSRRRAALDWTFARLKACCSIDLLTCLTHALAGVPMRGEIIENSSEGFDYVPSELDHLKLFRRFRLVSGVYSYQEMSALTRWPAPRIDARGYDIVLVDTPTRITVETDPGARVSCVVHDLLPITDVRLSDIATRLFLARLATTLTHATDLVFVSNYTRRRFRELFPNFAHLPERVVHPGTRFDAPTRPPAAHARPTFVVIVSNEYRKNIETLVRAFAHVPEADLVVIGRAGGLSSMRRITRNVTFAGYVEEQEKNQLIGNATALIMPSFAEGFGVPIIEAFAAGAPVLCSDIAVFREVAGDLALYFDPFSAQSIAQTVREAIASEALLRGRVARSRDALARRFDGDSQARHFLGPPRLAPDAPPSRNAALAALRADSAQAGTTTTAIRCAPDTIAAARS